MRNKFWIAGALGALLALPAAAQQTATHNANCETHRGDQIRCAMRIPMVGNYFQTVTLVTRGDGKVSGQAQVWISECGLPGSSGPVVQVTNNGRLYTLRQTNISALTVSCPEIFVFNCQAGGRAVPCSQGFAHATMRVEQQQR